MATNTDFDGEGITSYFGWRDRVGKQVFVWDLRT